MRSDTTGSSSDLFSQRKKDHIEISMRDESQAFTLELSRISFQHNALPELNFDQIKIDSNVFGHPLKCPFFISSMTLGHDGAKDLNFLMMEQAQERGWMMGVGSQRRQLFDPDAYGECEALRSRFPKAVIFGNIGLSQVISTPIEKLLSLVESLQAQFLVVHTNPLQEAIQPEGTPQFKGGIAALENLCKKSDVPVVLKETGCGFSKENFNDLQSVGLAAIDVSGLGGTHWGRVETYRLAPKTSGFEVGETFKDWGIGTVESLNNGVESSFEGEIWASGGVRSGLDGAKLLAMGASRVGLAQPILKSALAGEQALRDKLSQLEKELKISLFCLGIESVEQLVGKRELLRWK